MTEFLVAAFYKFTKLEDFASMQKTIEACCSDNNVKGIVLLAEEGINSTFAGNSLLAMLKGMNASGSSNLCPTCVCVTEKHVPHVFSFPFWEMYSVAMRNLALKLLSSSHLAMILTLVASI